MVDLVVKNGNVVSADSVVKADVVIEKGKIVALTRLENGIPAKTEIDATNRFVLPGVVDPHVHYHLRFKETATKVDIWSLTAIQPR